MSRFTQKNYVLQDFAGGVILAILYSWLFFHSLYTAFLFLPAFPWFHRARNKERKRELRTEKLGQCRDCFQAMASNIGAGYALENAVSRTTHEMERLWGAQAILIGCWKRMDQQIHMLHIPVEEAFMQFAESSELDVAMEEAGLLVIARRNGGDLAGLFRMSAEQIAATLSVESEIQTAITELKYEQGLMTLMPPGILFYLQIASYEMIEPLYTTLPGRITMVLCFGAYVFAVWLGRYFRQIEVE